MNTTHQYSWAKIITYLDSSDIMAGSPVNVESRTSSQDKRWTIMAALLGTNTAFMLFQGIRNYRCYNTISRDLFLNLYFFDGT
jgi:heme/copper-type cytochrome/quinol oxidase subunit 3